MEVEYKKIKLRAVGLGLCMGVKTITVAGKMFQSVFLILGVGKKHLTVALRLYNPRQIEVELLLQTAKGEK